MISIVKWTLLVIFLEPNLTTSANLKSSEKRTQTEMSTSRGKMRNGDITFPEDPFKPKCLDEGKPFCTKVEKYPTDELEKILKDGYSHYDVFFGNDVLEVVNISERMSPGQDTMCTGVEQISFPQAGKTKENGWLYIVNHGNYTQGVRTERCSNEGSPCMFSKIFPNGYVTTCEQHYLYRTMVALGKNGTITNDQFLFPSCCKCVIRQV